MKEETIVRLRKILREALTEDLDWEAIDGETTIESLGFDSLSVLDLLYDVDEAFGINLEAKDVVGAKTVGDIARLLEGRGA